MRELIRITANPLLIHMKVEPRDTLPLFGVSTRQTTTRSAGKSVGYLTPQQFLQHYHHNRKDVICH